VSSLKVLLFLCEVGTVTKSGTKGMIIDTPKDSLVNVLARVVKHNIYSFARKESIL
jgi:hypothetical protein